MKYILISNGQLRFFDKSVPLLNVRKEDDFLYVIDSGYWYKAAPVNKELYFYLINQELIPPDIKLKVFLCL